MSRAGAAVGPVCGLLALITGVTALWASYVPSTRAVVSIDGLTLRLDDPMTGTRSVFPVAAGRRQQPLGTTYSGPDPADLEYYLPRRMEPAFHRGLPFLRLGRSDRRVTGEVVRPYGIHGPITPSLIWGRVTAGCLRLQPGPLRRLFRAARLNPPLEVRVIAHQDRASGAPVELTRKAALPGCPEAAVGARRLEQVGPRSELAGRVCGAVDHWYAVELRGGNVLSARFSHGGELFLELYGIRAISTITRGRYGFEYVVPRAPKNRGPRYLRVFTPSGNREVLPFHLELKL